MNIRLLLLAPIYTVITSACTQNSPLLKGHETFLVTWKHDHSKLIIKSSGEVSYQHKEYTEKRLVEETFSDISSASVQAKISHFDSQSFRIGEGRLTKEFKINQAPRLEQGQWQ